MITETEEYLDEKPIETSLKKAIQNARSAFRALPFPFYVGNELPPGVTVAEYNRTVRRYAEKHDITLDEAFAAIYCKKGSTK